MSSFLGSVVQITNSDPEDDDFGTGFVIYHNEQVTYILTCAHVVNAIGDTKTMNVGGAEASVVASGPENGIDLAVLSVAGLQDKPCLRLSTLGKTGDKFTIVGSQSFKSNNNETGFVTREIHCTLSGQVELVPKNQPERIEAWDLKIIDDYQLEEGHSGSPVVEDASGMVIGVLSMREGWKKGIAIAVKALKAIWPGIPPSLFQEAGMGTISPSADKAGSIQEKDQTPGWTTELITHEERVKLIAILYRLPGITYANVRHSLVSTLPVKYQSNIAFKKPPVVHIAEIVDLVISDVRFKLSDGSYPIMVLIQNAINVMDDSKLTGDLQSLLKTLKERLGVVPQSNTATTSLGCFIQYLDNFILQIPALQYELRSISDCFDDYILQPDCETVGAHLTEVCGPFFTFSTSLKQSKDLPVISHRIWLMNALLDFNRKAKIVEDNINRFCKTYGAVLDESQPAGERQTIQNQLDALMEFCNSVLETAKNLSSELP